MEPAVILATMVVDTDVIEKGGVQALTVFDEEYQDMQIWSLNFFGLCFCRGLDLRARKENGV